jgi:tetratricopeptide (TPR) repeat protein
MRYDRLGFPIPPEFEVPAADGGFAAGGSGGSAPRPGRLKRAILVAILGCAVVPAVLGPAVLPAVREAVVQWSVERAVDHEARGRIAAAIGDVGRAVRWGSGDADRDASLLCWRAMLRIENRDPAGALADAETAAAIAPTATRPRRVRALANVMLERPEEALADAHAAVEIAAQGDPDALNHRAYIRALVGRELPEALRDIDAALAGSDPQPPELLDTRGFVLHLLGRHAEAIDDLNLAIAGGMRQRRELAVLAGRADATELAYRLRAVDHGLAVMHHHRGLACRAAGLEGQARQDLEIAVRKGFAPDRGVF